MQTRREIRPWDMMPVKDTAGAWFTLSARCPADFRIVWDAAVLKAREAGVNHPVPEIEAFMLIEMLAADYLASP